MANTERYNLPIEIFQGTVCLVLFFRRLEVSSTSTREIVQNGLSFTCMVQNNSIRLFVRSDSDNDVVKSKLAWTGFYDGFFGSPSETKYQLITIWCGS